MWSRLKQKENTIEYLTMLKAIHMDSTANVNTLGILWLEWALFIWLRCYNQAIHTQLAKPGTTIQSEPHKHIQTTTLNYNKIIWMFIRRQVYVCLIIMNTF